MVYAIVDYGTQFAKFVDRFRAQVWLAELFQITNLQSTYALASALDPDSVYKDQDNKTHLSKWYRYADGTAVPSPELADRVKKQVPRAQIAVHHPVWRLLRSQRISMRSQQRLISQMSKQSKIALKQLVAHPLKDYEINTQFVTDYGLIENSYCDSLLLFFLAWKGDFSLTYAQQRALESVVIDLPTLHADDALFGYADRKQLSDLAEIVGGATTLFDGTDMIVEIFYDDSMSLALEMRRQLIDASRLRPDHFSTRRARRLFLAKAISELKTEQRPYQFG